jgi:phosphoglycerate dehydrogenase-like enzyme
MSNKIAVYLPDKVQFDGYVEVAPEGTSLNWVDSTLPLEEQIAQLQDAVVIIGDTQVEVASRCPNLKLIQVSSAGTDKMNLPALEDIGIKVSNNGGANAIAVSEHAITLMMTVLRKLDIQFESVKERKWAGKLIPDWWPYVHELTGSTVGIIGLGAIGQQVARRLAGWDCTLLYEDAFEHSPELVAELGVQRVTRDELLTRSDVVTLHVPLMDATRGMMSDREFGLMKKSAILINTCRGPVVDEAALIRALNAKEIMAAGLDVLEVEPTPDDNPLIDMDNVSITPHVASVAQESWIRSRGFAVQNAIRVANGGDPLAIVTPERP